MIKTSVEPWIEEPLQRFVKDAGVIFALLLNPSGQVLGQHGFSRAIDVMTACALAAAIHATSSELGNQLQGKSFGGLHHAGKDRQVYLAEAQTTQGPYIFLTVFDEESSLGLVRMYFDEFRSNLAASAPLVTAPAEPMLDLNFEQDLNRNLAVLFGRG